MGSLSRRAGCSDQNDGCGDHWQRESEGNLSGRDTVPGETLQNAATGVNVEAVKNFQISLSRSLGAWGACLSRLTACAVLIVLWSSDLSAADDFASEAQPLLEKYCYKCHDDDTQKGDLNLFPYTGTSQIIADRKLWLRVLEQLETREMPTKDPLPTEEEYEALITWVDDTVNDIDWTVHRHPGHVTIPRLTKREYGNTMRELLGIDLDLELRFSEDGEGQSGFDNDRDALFVTPAMLEKYFQSAELGINALTAHREVPAGQMEESFFEAEAMFITEMGSKVRTWSDTEKGYVLDRGQQTLYESVEFPVDGFYEFTVRSLTTQGPTGARLRIDDVPRGDLAVPSKQLTENKLVAFVEAGSRQMAWNIQKPVFRKGDASRTRGSEVDKELPEDASQIITRESKQHAPAWSPVDSDAKFADVKVGESLVSRVNANAINVQRAWEWLHLHGADGNARELERFLKYIDDRSVRLNEAKDALAAALSMKRAAFDLEFEKRNVAALKRNADLGRAIEKSLTSSPLEPAGLVGIDWIKVRGPVAPARLTDEKGKSATVERVFVAEPGGDISEQDAVRAVLENFLPRAFRRPATDVELAHHMAIYHERRGQQGSDYPDALKLSLSAALVSPNFLFRREFEAENAKLEEQAEAGANEFELDDWQLASRLSYYLWQSMPDEILFGLAEQGKLRDAETLRAQVRRMLNDPRAKDFSRLFVGQWLGFGPDGQNMFPDERKFRKEWSEDLRAAMVAETELFFDALIDDKQSLLLLVDSRFTFLNETLAKHYRIDNVFGSEMQRVALPDHRRGGVLGMGSVLTATSTPTRSSPVVRGAWLLEKLLAERVPPPPPNAGELPDDAGEKKGKLTLREELEAHRDKADCRGCHEKIDPLGFGLEHFDAVGVWRANSPSGPIDASGTLPSGESFTGVAELKRFILKNRREPFLRGVSEAMLKFALGRELKGYDEPVIQKILAELESNDCDASVLIEEVVLSYPFRFQGSHE